MFKTSSRIVPSALALAVLILASRPAKGHDKWLEAEPFVAAIPGPTKLYLLTGDALRQPEPLPFRQRNRMTRFQLVTSSLRRDLSQTLREDAQPIASLPAGTLPAGTSLILLDTAPTDILLTAEKFQAYLFEERLSDILMQRADQNEEETPGRERYSRFVKALVQLGSQHDSIASKPAGQELEIVPAYNPYALPIGSKLSVQVLYRGQPLSKRSVTFANRYHFNVVTKNVRTDEQGRAEVILERPGLWLASLVHMERSREPGADWRSYWSSLTFALPPTQPQGTSAE